MYLLIILQYILNLDKKTSKSDYIPTKNQTNVKILLPNTTKYGKILNILRVSKGTPFDNGTKINIEWRGIYVKNNYSDKLLSGK